MSKHDDIVGKIDQARYLAWDILQDLEVENSDGKQLDYVTSSRLANAFDGLERTVSKIEKIIYQST